MMDGKSRASILGIFASLICALNNSACSSSQSGATPGTGGGGGSSNSASTCAICTCQPKSSVRPAGAYQVVNALTAGLQGKGDPGSTYIGIMPNHGSPFWSVPQIGFSEAKTEIGCLGDFQLPPAKSAPLDTIIQAQINYLNDWTTPDGDLPVAAGVALSCKSAAALQGPINDAIAAGVNVITMDSDSVDSNRLIYVGTLNEPAGELAGNEMLRMLGDSTTAIALVLGGQETEANSNDRIAGIQAAFGMAGRSSQVVVTHIVADSAVQQALDDAAAQYGENLGGIFTLGSTFAPVAGDWLVSKGLSGKTKLVVWDVSTATNDYIANGVIQDALAQKSYFFGYLPTYILYAMTSLGVDQTLKVLDPYLTGPKHDLLDTGVDLITPDNLNDYASYQKTCLDVTGG